jgi:hypothetical protein
MKDKDSLSFPVSLWPLPVAVAFHLWPCLGFTLVVGATAFTVAFVVTTMDDLAPPQRFRLP